MARFLAGVMETVRLRDRPYSQFEAFFRPLSHRGASRLF